MDNLDRAILEHLQALRAGMDRIEIGKEQCLSDSVLKIGHTVE